MHEWLMENVTFIKDLTKIIRGKFEVPHKRKIIENLLITDVHNRDIVLMLYE